MVEHEAGAGSGAAGEPGAGAESPPPLPDLVDAGMYLVDDRGRIIQVNSAAEKLLARTADELLGQDAHELLHRDARGQTIPRAQCAMMQSFLGASTGRGQGWFERGDGSPLPMSWLVTPCRAGAGRTGAMVLFHESTPLDGAQWQESGTSAPRSELDRLALLAETTTLLTSTLVIDETVQRLEQLVVPRLADWVVVDLINEGGEVQRASVVGHQEGHLVHLTELEGPMPPVPEESPLPLPRALRGAASTVASPSDYERSPDSGIAVAQRELFRATGMHSAAIAPIRGLREVIGALTLGRSTRPEEFRTRDLSLLNDIARRAGLALDNARLFQRQRRIAETMQRHLLPRLPGVPGVQMTVRYLPSPEASQVGGDWYDAFVLPDGVAALAIGDVVGHDLDAAAGMAQVRNMLRAYAWAAQEPPSVIVDRLDQAMQHATDASMATLIFARLERRAEVGDWCLTWTNAGHPPPMLVHHDGRVEFLDGGHDILLGTGISTRRTDASLALPPRSTLVFYTDGLIESPGHSLDAGLLRLSRTAASLAHRPLDAFCDLMLSRVRPADNEDDVAVLALRLPHSG
ncbi:SpoIIE family protein phosphatase [Streptomyces hoynatensis]|uniref:protein-serine/threonine phosphatase n=1 Tax=Streptomyces hoynatensis TaxID=1141874 RepID=A0A3A9YVP2_9ACTN|nr:SpoIIE family protein phosphatase [Streptomyces hoynatensis]RKN40065.1 GAF domain-containing protein [Streptomyces hoynatensis]